MANNVQYFTTNPGKLGALLVAAGATLISFSGVYVKLAHVSPTVAGFYRTFFGGIILLVIVWMRGGLLWQGFYHFFLGVLCGFLLALDLFFWHISIHFIGPGLATILGNFQVFLLALFGVLVLKEKPTINLLLAIPLAMLGLYLLAGIQWGDFGQNYKVGIFLGLATALCYASYLLVLRRLQISDDYLSPVTNLVIICFVTAAFLGTTAWQQSDSFEIPDLQSLLSLSGYGLFSQVIGWVLITKGLPKIKSSLTGLLLLLQPALAFVWDMLFFDRKTSIVGGIGAVFTLAAIYMGATSHSDSKR
ncbi:MAG: DMT family transporter [Deltaproteobacteria bacterium]|nr:MAG: DMT family transporter [Deltaproteobacteria bacterium]